MNSHVRESHGGPNVGVRDTDRWLSELGEVDLHPRDVAADHAGGDRVPTRLAPFGLYSCLVFALCR